MKHVYEFYIKHNKEPEINSIFITNSGRMGKVADKVLEQINKQRSEAEMWLYERADLEDFRLKKLR